MKFDTSVKEMARCSRNVFSWCAKLSVQRNRPNSLAEPYMSEMKLSEKHKVVVDDNYHHGEGDRYESGSYASLEEALDKCKEITVESLEHFYEKGISPDDLHAQWLMFGEDPYIVGADGPVPFSARKFITTELCQQIIDSKLAQ